MDQQRCCILGICCVPFSAEQEAALAEYLFAAMGFKDGLADSGELRSGCRAAAKKLFADGLIRQAA